MMLSAVLVAAVLASPQEAKLKTMLPEVFAKCAAHYRALDAAATPLMNSGDPASAPNGERLVPHGWKAAEVKLDMRSIYWWTSGHFPGSLWYLYEATGDVFFKDRATVWTEWVSPNSKVSDNHDVGFIMYCSFGNARRLLKTVKYDALLLETADSLSKRFDERLGLIRSWGEIGETENFLVIPDNMMNLELLEWASKANGGENRFDKIARSHATKTMAHHFRADGGTYHVLDYDQETLRVKGIMRGQGASCETAWARGQAWAIYGYTMMYRETKDPSYLAFAQKVSDFAIDNPNMPEDGVPYWDFGAPGEERDSSAAAVMASGLLELSTFVSGEKGAKYRAFAVKQLLSLSSDAYFAKPGENGNWILKHGVGHKPAGSEIDTPLDYGDYYYLEALLRFRSLGVARQDGPVGIIFDTDMLTDFDDVGALACLHALMDAGECEILATVSCTRGNASVGAIEIINRYYGRPDIPVGCAKDIGVIGARPGSKSKVDPTAPLGGCEGNDGGHDKYRKLLVDYPGWCRYADSDDAPDANEVYRRALASRPDGSVVVCSVGFLTNLRRLLETKPDGISPLDGRTLVAKKVRKLVSMACSYPNGKEYNSMWDASSSRIVFESWPTEIVFSDFQYGRDVFAGRALAESGQEGRNPVREIFAGNIPSREAIAANSAEWLRRSFGMGGRSAWDETAVLVAVRGEDSYFNVSRGCYRMVGEDGSDEWAPDEKGPHARITEKLSKAEVGRIIDGLLLRKP